MKQAPERLLPLTLPGGVESLGLLSEPQGVSASRVGVLIVVGGPQTRVGSHRHFVQLARALAQAGYPTLRFDHRGLGDAVAPLQPFDQLDSDIAAAIDLFASAQPQLQGFVLWGLCDAAAAALLYVGRRQDPRVLGLALLNPWVRTPQSEARAQVRHYYLQRLRERSFWTKLLRGGVGLRAVRGWAQARRLARQAAPSEVSLPFPEQMGRAWQQFAGPVLLQLAGRDLTAQEFLDTAERSWPSWSQRARLTRHDHPQALHTFPAAADKAAVNEQLLDWLRQHFPSGAQP